MTNFKHCGPKKQSFLNEATKDLYIYYKDDYKNYKIDLYTNYDENNVRNDSFFDEHYQELVILESQPYKRLRGLTAANYKSICHSLCEKLIKIDEYEPTNKTKYIKNEYEIYLQKALSSVEGEYINIWIQHDDIKYHIGYVFPNKKLTMKQSQILAEFICEDLYNKL